MTTMIADPPSKTTMGVGFDANRSRTSNPEAWKRAIGTKPIAARLALLPDSKPRWDRIGISAGSQLAILAFVLLIPLVFPQQMKTALNFQIVELMQPVTLIPVAPPPPPPPKAKVKTPPAVKPEVPEPVKLNPKQPHVFLTAKAEPPKMRTVDAKPVELNPTFDQVKVDMPTNQPKRPKEDVKVGNLGSGSAAPATVVAPVNKVQTRGFGDPTVATDAPKKKAVSGEGTPTTVEILEKPRPEYTAEGRRLKIEGDVVLEIVFLANGSIQVNRVVSGLGHGLDEAATRAAQQIKFKPAKRDGQPVDFPARVRIEFRMAY